MKIVKYVFLLLVLAAVAITVFIATQNGQYTIEQKKLINAPRPVLFGYVNDYKNWGNLDILTDADSTAAYTISENSTGKSASMAWKKNSTTGNIATTNVINNDSIIQKASINGLDSDIRWAFKDTVGGTKVSVKIYGELTFSEKATALLEHGKISTTLEKSVNKGLNNLNAFLVSELKKFSVEVKGVVTKKGTFYMGQTITSAAEDVNKNAAATFVKLLAFTKENKIIVTGAPFILYKNYSRNQATATYTLALPIKEEIFTSPGSEYEGGKLQPYNALKTALRGDYTHLPKAWAAADIHIAEKALIENPALPYLVSYSKNIRDTRRPSAWVSDIYIPVGPAIVQAQDTLQVPMPVIQARPATSRPETTTPAPARATTTTQKTAVVKPVTGTKAPAATTVPKTTGTTTPKTSGTTAPKAAATTAPKAGSTASKATTTAKPAATTKPKPKAAQTPTKRDSLKK
jgi:hypothetical protein